MTTQSAFVFEKDVAELGRLRLRPICMPDDIPIVHAWVSQDYARFWGLCGRSQAEVAEVYRELARTTQIYLGLRGAEPAFLVECYRPNQHAVGDHYPTAIGDRGMHVLVAPAAVPISGFTWSVFAFIMDFLFSDPDTERVVVEPDIRNAKIHALNRRAGFRYQKPILLPDKVAHLAFCTRADYYAALATPVGVRARDVGDESLVEHLRPEIWAAANRALLRKTIAELAHERVLEPHSMRKGARSRQFRLTTDRPDTEYRFEADVLSLEHWEIDGASITKLVGGNQLPLDAVEFLLEVQSRLGMSPEALPVYVEEIISTLYAAAYKLANARLSTADLVHADLQEIECAMTEGHPAFIANNGRVGFDAADYRAYAPEIGAPIQLVWLAAHQRNTAFRSISELEYAQLIREELDHETLERFAWELQRRGLDAGAYVLLPVHPWQWFNKLAFVFAADIATNDIVCLGQGPDRYRAQQSVRTLFNHSQPHKRYVKTALSVLNMGFMRGLSPDYMLATPAINEWIDRLLRGDPFFAEHGFGILREVASVGYRNRRFEAAVSKDSPYRKMLAALWRESPVPRLARGQRLMTMAALLHRDRDGHALLPQLILASGLSSDAWIDRYLDCYLAPLLHCFYRHDLAFMPHGENLILVLEQGVPSGAYMKDIAEEAVIFDSTRVLPDDVKRLQVFVPHELRLLSIFTDVFDGIFRFVAANLQLQAEYPEQRFWSRVARCVHRYRKAHPELRQKLDEHDLFAPEFRHSCLNRLQLRDNRQLIDLADPSKNLQFAGVLTNPIASFRQEHAVHSATAQLEPAR